jgi:hypothetical protein
MGWLILTFILGAAIMGFVLWARNKNISIKWYDWLVGAVGIVLVVAATQHFFGSLREDYLQPGVLGALTFGLPGLILLAVAWQLVARRQRAG